MTEAELGLAVASNIALLSEDEIASLSTEERRAETFLLYSLGWTQVRISRYFGVAQATVAKDLKLEAQRRHSRAENLEDELERVAGVMERVIEKAWARHDEAFFHNPNGVAASNYLKLVLDAAEKYAHIRGIDIPVSKGGGAKGPTRVIVKIGGDALRPEIAVGVETDGD